MAPKRLGGRKEQNVVLSTLASVAAPENRSIVTALGVFAAGVAFFHSSWSEMLLPA